MNMNNSLFDKAFFKKVGINSKKALIISIIICIGAISLITTSAIAAINYKANSQADKQSDSPKENTALSKRVTFHASFPMANWRNCITKVSTSPTPTSTPTPTEEPSAEEEEAVIEAAIAAPEAQIKPDTGSVLTSSEYKYEASEDPGIHKDEDNYGDSSNTIGAVTTTPTAVPTTTPTANPAPTPTPSPSPTIEATPDSTPSIEGTPDSTPSTDAGASPSVSPSEPSSTPSVPVYAEGWNTIDGGSYYYLNGGFVTGWADLGGFRYYFNQTGLKKSKVGIDVSVFQDTINWTEVKNAGVDFVIIRAGFRGYGTEGNLRRDSNFEENIKGALAAGLQCGAYIYSAATTEIEGAQEANFLLNAVKDYNITGPLVMDVECLDGRTANLSSSQRTNATLAGLKVLKDAGYSAMLYTGHNFYDNHLQASRLTNYPLWIAHYTSDYNNVSDVPYTIWQYTSSGRVPGISGRVDLNIWK